MYLRPIEVRKLSNVNIYITWILPYFFFEYQNCTYIILYFSNIILRNFIILYYFFNMFMRSSGVYNNWKDQKIWKIQITNINQYIMQCMHASIYWGWGWGGLPVRWGHVCMHNDMWECMHNDMWECMHEYIIMIW